VKTAISQKVKQENMSRMPATKLGTQWTNLASSLNIKLATVEVLKENYFCDVRVKKRNNMYAHDWVVV
jgi:hypothetical protein